MNTIATHYNTMPDVNQEIQAELLPGESILAEAHVAPIVYKPFLIAGAVCAGIPGLLFPIMGSNGQHVAPSGSALMMAMIMAVGLFCLYRGIKFWMFAKQYDLYLTNQRVLFRTGFINNRGVVSTKLGAIDSITCIQSIVGRTFDFGTFRIVNRSGRAQFVRYVGNASEFARACYAAREALATKDGTHA